MINIGGSVGGKVEVYCDFSLDRVGIKIPGGPFAFWLTDEETDRLVVNLQEAARELRRRREEKGRL